MKPLIRVFSIFLIFVIMEKETVFKNDPFQLEQIVTYKSSFWIRLLILILVIIFSVIPLFDFVEGFEPNNGFIETFDGITFY